MAGAASRDYHATERTAPMKAQPRLFPVPVDIALFTLSREPDGWRLSVRTGASRERFLEKEPDLYEQLTLNEAGDVLAAVLDGIEP